MLVAVAVEGILLVVAHIVEEAVVAIACRTVAFVDLVAFEFVVAAVAAEIVVEQQIAPHVECSQQQWEAACHEFLISKNNNKK